MGKIIRNGIEYGDVSASCISFTPGGGLLSDNVQDAIDEINNKIPAAQVNADWNATSGVAQILNKPTIPAAQVNSDWNATSGVAQILNKPTIPAAQVNSDWNSSSGVSQILNKPTIPTNTNQLTNGAGFITSSGSCASATASSYVKDYNNNTPTYFGFGTATMAQSAVTYVGAWDGSTSGQYRLRAVKQSDLKVAYATSAGSATDSTKEPKLSWTYKSSTGSWNYWKDSSGRYHMTYSSGNQSINFNGTIGSLKYRTTTFDLTPPFSMTSLHSIVASTCCANDLTGVTVQSYTTTSIKLYLWAATAGTKTIQIHMDIITT